MKTQFTYIAQPPAAITLANLKEFVAQCETLGATPDTDVAAVVEQGDITKTGRLVALGLEQG